MGLGLEVLNVGVGADARAIAMRVRSGMAPGLFWLGGFRSEMTGNKARRIDALGEKRGLAVTRFDYSGHGESGGEFLEGTISRWLEESLAVFETTTGPQIVAASSIGCWLALLLNRALRAQGDDRLKALILVAPAVDATEMLRTGFTPAQLHDLHMKGQIERSSAYEDGPYVITERLIRDGATHLMLDKGSIVTGCPVHIVHGKHDPDVPLERALDLLRHLTQDPVNFTLIPDGDHRLSRPQDLELLEAIVSRLADAAS